MSESDTQPTEGYVNFSYPTLETPTQTWYQIHGNLTPTSHPIILLHGGPGASSIYLTPLIRLHSLTGHPIILYDQIGCGKSTHLRHRRLDTTFWTVPLFIAELNNLLSHLSITSFTILGHSWGGMFGAEYAISQNENDPSRGLKRLIISNSPASMPLWVTSCNEWRAQLPDNINDTLTRLEAAQDYADPEYIAATTEFYKRHMCRVSHANGVDPFPDPLMLMLKNIDDDDTVYFTMNGPSEFAVIGNLKEWNVVGRLEGIKVPTLVVSGEFDEAREVCVRPFVEGVRGSEWVVLEGTSHCGFLEETERYCGVVGGGWGGGMWRGEWMIDG